MSLGGAWAGCSAPPALPVRVGLVAAVSGAAPVLETVRLDLGSPEARRALVLGWSRDEVAADGTGFAWGLGDASTLDVLVLRHGPRTLKFRCWPFAPAGAPPQSVGVRVDDREVARITLRPEAAEYTVSLDADALPAGTHRVQLAYDHHLAPSDTVPGSGDGRPLAVAWDWIAWTQAPPAAPRAEGESVVFPAGAGVRFALRAEPGDRLDWTRAELDGAGPAALRVVVRAPSGRVTREVAVPGDAMQLDLGAGPGGWISLDLLPVTGPGVRAVRLVGPAIRNAAAHGAEAVATTAPVGTPPNVLLYVIDALRADHLGCYGYERSVSPGIDAFARSATLFENARASSSWTKTSMASILTGLPPRSHGANRRDEALSGEISTLAERLRDAGFATAAFVTNPNLAPSFGFDQGFEDYAFLTETRVERGYVRSDVLHQRAVAWLDARPADRPFFLYLHSMDAHDPYVSGDDARVSRVGSMSFMRALEQGRVAFSPELRHELLGMYDDEIAFNDAGFAALMEHLDASAAGRDTLVVLVADHGEEFYDHGWWRHGKTLFEEQLHVPLVVRFPDGRGRGARVAAPVRQIDLAPTVLEAAGLVSQARSLPGRSLAGPVAGTAAEPEPEFALVDVDGRHVESLRLGPLKLIRYLSYDRPRPPVELFDLATDPREAVNSAQVRGAAADRLEALLEVPAFGGLAGTSRHVEVDAALAERLRAVGYLQ